MGISVEEVRKQFGDFVALDNVSVEVASGSLTALLGPSGGGKSTLLRVIAGLEEPDVGEVFNQGGGYAASMVLAALALMTLLFMNLINKKEERV